jgi:hypothetical protein
VSISVATPRNTNTPSLLLSPGPLILLETRQLRCACLQRTHHPRQWNRRRSLHIGTITTTLTCDLSTSRPSDPPHFRTDVPPPSHIALVVDCRNTTGCRKRYTKRCCCDTRLQSENDGSKHRSRQPHSCQLANGTRRTMCVTESVRCSRPAGSRVVEIGTR